MYEVHARMPESDLLHELDSTPFGVEKGTTIVTTRPLLPGSGYPMCARQPAATAASAAMARRQRRRQPATRGTSATGRRLGPTRACAAGWPAAMTAIESATSELRLVRSVPDGSAELPSLYIRGFLSPVPRTSTVQVSTVSTGYGCFYGCFLVIEARGGR